MRKLICKLSLLAVFSLIGTVPQAHAAGVYEFSSLDSAFNTHDEYSFDPFDPFAPPTVTTVATANQGYYNVDGSQHDVGRFGAVVNTDYGLIGRAYVTFDLASLNLAGQQIVSVSLSTGSGIGNPFTLYDVSTNALNLNTGLGGVAAYNDLGTGISYGSFPSMSDGGFGSRSVGLNSAVYSDVAGHAGGFFSIGQVIATTSYGSTAWDGPTILTVTTANVPEPKGNFLWLALGMLCLASRPRSRAAVPAC